MDYREFTGAVEEQMNRRLEGGVRASLYTAVKNNGKERTGVLIEAPGINISPTIYLEEYFEDYQKGRDLGTIVGEILAFYESIRQENSWDCEKLKKYDGVKDRIVFKLINTAKNRKFLSTVPHRSFLDLSVVFYVLLEVTADGTAAADGRNAVRGAGAHKCQLHDGDSLPRRCSRIFSARNRSSGCVTFTFCGSPGITLQA